MQRSRAALLLLLAACGPSTLEIHAVGAHAVSEFLKNTKPVLDVPLVEVGRQWQGHPEQIEYIEAEQTRLAPVLTAYNSAVAAWALWHAGLSVVAEGGEYDLEAIVEAGRYTVRQVRTITTEHLRLTGEELPPLADYILRILGGE